MILSSLKPPPSKLTKPDELHVVYVECVCACVHAYIYAQLFLTLTYSFLRKYWKGKASTFVFAIH